MTCNIKQLIYVRALDVLSFKVVPPSLPALPLLRSSKTLQDFIAQLDKEYDSLNEMMAKGHTDNFGTACWAKPCDVHIPEGHLCQPFSQT